ncbi:hypothetical protein F5Y04DRAFT_35392 [Hypomontagnella monticulosa]|nr:hypothetical protein F5Y04DRAFT_35392 [Hypomontagnella monticulosa]
MSSANYYRVWKLKAKLAIQDPDMSGERFHHSVFVETDDDGSGIKFHVTGDITSGMSYESKPHNPQSPDTEETKELLGYTNARTVPNEWDALLNQQKPPPKQKAFNIETMKTEPVKSWEPLTFYSPGEQRRPLWKCTEWIEHQALPALYGAGFIVQTLPQNSTSNIHSHRS